jgi:hypothetical protein
VTAEHHFEVSAGRQAVDVVTDDRCARALRRRPRSEHARFARARKGTRRSRAFKPPVGAVIERMVHAIPISALALVI